MYWKGRSMLAELAEIGGDYDFGGGAKGPAPVVLMPKAPAGPTTIMPPGFFDPLNGQYVTVQPGVATGIPGGGVSKPNEYVITPRPPTPKELAIKKQIKAIEELRKKKEALEAENKAAAEKHAKFLRDTNPMTGDIAPPKDLPPREPYPGEDRLTRRQKDQLEAALQKEARDRSRLEAEKRVADQARQEVRARGEATEKWRQQQKLEAAAEFVMERTRAHEKSGSANASQKAYGDLARLQIGRAITGVKKGLEGIENKRAQEFGAKVAEYLSGGAG